MPDLMHQYFGEASDFGGKTVMNQMPMAVSSLINDTTSITLDIEPGKTYLVRMVSVAALFPHKISFEDHGEFSYLSFRLLTNLTLIRHDHCSRRWHSDKCNDC
jgi:hypothetical protein